MENLTANPDMTAERDVLYLECATDLHHNITVSSLIAVFLQNYCHYYHAEIILVRKHGGCSHQRPKIIPGHNISDASSATTIEDNGNVVGRASSDISYTEPHGLELLKCLQDCKILLYESVPRVVQDCQLPCIVLPGQQMCVSGLASVLRWIVEVSAPKEPHRNLEALLGFRQTCLKGCSESSVWTKLCEVEAPLQISQLISEASSISSSTKSPSPAAEMASSLTSASCPPFLSKFQELLGQPVSTFNSEKLRRKLMKKESKKKQGKTRERGKKGSEGVTDQENKQEQHNDGSLERIDTVNDDTGVIAVNSNVERDAEVHERSEETEGEGENIATKLNSGVETSKSKQGKTERSSGALERDEVLDSEVGELQTEFNTKIFLCNKKQMRQQKRTLRQSANQDVSEVPSSGEKTSKPVLTETLNDIESSKQPSIDIDQRSNEGPRSRRSNRRPRNKNVVHKDSLPELSHTFALGIDVSLVDFALLLPVHLYLFTSQRNGRFHEACMTTPLVLQWYKRMWDVPSVRQVVSACLEMDEVVLPVIEDVCNVNADVEENSKTPCHLSSSDIQPGNGNLRVSRNVVRELLKKVLPGVITSLESQNLTVTFSNHPAESTAVDWTSMAPAVRPIEGELEAHRASKKEHQIESIVAAVKDIAQPGHRILDFCSGGGHLGIALAYCLPECHVIMIENKEESLRRALGRVQTLQLRNVTLYLSNIDYFNGSFDIGVSLHACGVATDIVLSKCMDQGAAFVSSPCCYGGLHDTHHMTYPRSRVFQEKSLSKRDYFLLGHGAEQTCWNFESPLAVQGGAALLKTPSFMKRKQCMGYIDMDRAELARERGYRVTLCSLQPQTCSPKNNLLIGISPNI